MTASQVEHCDLTDTLDSVRCLSVALAPAVAKLVYPSGYGVLRAPDTELAFQVRCMQHVDVRPALQSIALELQGC